MRDKPVIHVVIWQTEDVYQLNYQWGEMDESKIWGVAQLYYQRWSGQYLHNQ